MKKIENYFANKEVKGVSLLRKSKKDYFPNLNEKNITDKKTFMENSETLLFKKTSSSWINKCH